MQYGANVEYGQRDFVLAYFDGIPNLKTSTLILGER